MNLQDVMAIGIPALVAAIGAVVAFQILDRLIGPWYKKAAERDRQRKLENAR